MENKYKAWFYLLLAMLFWGMSFVWTRQLLVHLSPISIVFIRLVISTFFLLGISLLLGKFQKVSWSTLKWIALMSLFEPFLYFIFEGYGIQETSASFASIMIATIPLFTPIGGWIFLKEKIATMNIIGLLISFLGVSVIVLNQGSGIKINLWGFVLLLGAVLTAVGYFTILKRVADKVNAFSVATYQNIFGLLYFIPVFLAVHGIGEVKKMPLTFDLLFPLIALSVLASSLAFVFNTIGVRIIGPSKAAAFTNSIPVFTVIFAYFLLGETVGVIKLTGMGFVIVGLVLAQKKKWRRVPKIID